MSRRLSAFLGSEAELLEALAQSSDDVMTRKALLTAATKRAAEWNDLAPAQTRAWLRSVIARVVVGEASVELLLRRSALRTSLLGEKPLPSAELSSSDDGDQDDLLSLTVEARLRRCTGELRLVLPSGSAHAVSQSNPALIKAIARGYRWYERLASGKVSSLAAIAKEVGVSQRYVSRVVRASLLAPDLVEMILEGRQPPQLTVEHLFDRLPIDWNEQRRMFTALGR